MDLLTFAIVIAVLDCVCFYIARWNLSYMERIHLPKKYYLPLMGFVLLYKVTKMD